MSKLTKNQKAAAEKFDSHKLYTLTEACQIVKDITFTKFDASVELSVNLGVDPRKANQMVFPILKPYRDRRENRQQWCIAAVPGAAWARKGSI